MSKAHADAAGYDSVGLFSMYNPNRLEVEYDAGGASMTRQEFSDECNINVIMERYQKTGVWPFPENGSQPLYYDFTEVPTDLQTSMQYMIDAEEAFMKLPGVVRKEFDNDAMRFVEFASDRANLERMREWGLAEPEKVADAPVRVEVVSTAAAAAPTSEGA